jgi:hypothetical protein
MTFADEDSTPVLAFWRYLGSGYVNPGDVLLAAGVEASIRVGREALFDLRRGPPGGGVAKEAEFARRLRRECRPAA